MQNIEQLRNKDFQFHYSRAPFIEALIKASQLLSDHKDYINKLNVFPVPDGDTGTNMSLTLDSVVEYVKKLGPNPSVSEIRQAITTGSLMGARGNSGVITSQILRGLCEGYKEHEFFDTEGLSLGFTKAEEIAFASVSKPVDGTILTVLRDSAKAARHAYKKKWSVDKAMSYVSDRAYESVEYTPYLLPVLKENGVVDAGGYGLAILIEGIASSLTGMMGQMSRSFKNDTSQSVPRVEIEQKNDWAGSKYTYCNEFLVESNCLDIDSTLQFLASIGDCELCVGSCPKYKVHVHSDFPHKVLEYFVDKGQIFEVFIHNMKMQSEKRVDELKSDHVENKDDNEKKDVPPKNLGIVAVASGQGCENILKSLGVDEVVCGGQTMNPSTKDLADAVSRVNAKNVIIMPNNKNIFMAAHAACNVANVNCEVLETYNITQAFCALMILDPESDINTNIDYMNESFSDLKTAEITRAVRDSIDSKGDPIKKDDYIGIVDDKIESSSNKLEDVVLELLQNLNAKEMDIMTFLVGQDLSLEEAKNLGSKIEELYPDLEIDIQEGSQPLYPVIFSLQ